MERCRHCGILLRNSTQIVTSFRSTAVCCSKWCLAAFEGEMFGYYSESPKTSSLSSSPLDEGEWIDSQ